MDSSINLVIEGDNCLRWIQEDKETGLIDLLFDCNEKENVISLTPGLFKKVAEMMSNYLKGDVEISQNKRQKIVNNILSQNGKITPGVCIPIEDDEMSVEICWECIKENPELIIKTKRSGSFSIFMTPKQAKEIANRCLKIATVRALFNETLKARIIQAKA